MLEKDVNHLVFVFVINTSSILLEQQELNMHIQCFENCICKNLENAVKSFA